MAKPILSTPPLNTEQYEKIVLEAIEADSNPKNLHLSDLGRHLAFSKPLTGNDAINKIRAIRDNTSKS